MAWNDINPKNINPIFGPIHKEYIDLDVLNEQVKVLRGKGEKDPLGIKPSDPGAKLDDGKVMASLLIDMSNALLAVAEVGTFGAKKYSRGGWLSVPDGYLRYTDAMLRHLLAQGEYDDGPGGIGTLHDAQVAWNALARLEIKLRGK